MHYLVYKTTCLVNNKIYIGVHSTLNKDDSYLGSGVEFTKAVKKYGRENFIREILFECQSAEEMFEKEKELVTENFIECSENYNMIVGGKGSTLANYGKDHQCFDKIWIHHKKLKQTKFVLEEEFIILKEDGWQKGKLNIV